MRESLKTLEEQLVSVARRGASPERHRHPARHGGNPPPRSPHGGVGHATSGSPRARSSRRDLRVDSPLSARRRHDFGPPSGESGPEDRARLLASIPRSSAISRRPGASSRKPRRRRTRPRRRRRTSSAFASSCATSESKPRGKRWSGSGRATTRSAARPRRNEPGPSPPRLRSSRRGSAVRDAEERSEKVRAAAEALEAAELRRRLAEDEAARLRKTTPEREKGSPTSRSPS